MKQMTPQDFLEQYDWQGKTPMHYKDGVRFCFMDKFYDFMEAYAQHLEQAAWVSVKERMPEDGKHVILAFEENCVGDGH